MPNSVSKLIARASGWPARGLLGLVRVYQKVISPVLPAVFGPACGCRFHPTCSHYAADALRTHGAVSGSWLTLQRLVKCTPLHAGGLDPVPARRPTCARANATPPTTQSLFHG